MAASPMLENVSARTQNVFSLHLSLRIIQMSRCIPEHRPINYAVYWNNNIDNVQLKKNQHSIGI